MEAIDQEAADLYKALADEAIYNKRRYLGVELDTNVPWMLIAALHMREASFDWDTYLGNGQPLDQVTTLVPAGRGPFSSWEEGAIDALQYDGMDQIIDWRLEKMLFNAEAYNGTGYHNKGLPSPYLWALTNIQEPGKYVADGEFDENYWDTQPGCAGLLYAINKINPPSQYQRETATPQWFNLKRIHIEILARYKGG
jgi:lysozyme family protein